MGSATRRMRQTLSAKLYNALWNARTAGEGGDDNLRYTMNLDAVSDTLSLLL